MVVDFLAKYGATGKNIDFDGNNIGLGRFRGLLRMDFLELPYICN